MLNGELRCLGLDTYRRRRPREILGHGSSTQKMRRQHEMLGQQLRFPREAAATEILKKRLKYLAESGNGKLWQRLQYLNKMEATPDPGATA